MSATLTFLQALTQAERQALALPPELHTRVRCAVALIKDGHVFQTTTGTWQVRSTTQPDVLYTVNGTCECADYRYHTPPRGLCKHRLAMYLSQRVLTLTQEPPAPTTSKHTSAPSGNAPIGALPEARASLNFRAMVGHFDVQITLRDETEGAILDRLQVLLTRHDIQPVPKPAARLGHGKR